MQLNSTNKRKKDKNDYNTTNANQRKEKRNLLPHNNGGGGFSEIFFFWWNFFTNFQSNSDYEKQNYRKKTCWFCLIFAFVFNKVFWLNFSRINSVQNQTEIVFHFSHNSFSLKSHWIILSFFSWKFKFKGRNGTCFWSWFHWWLLVFSIH